MNEWVILLALCGRGDCHAFMLGDWESEAACQVALEQIVQIMKERNFAAMTKRRTVVGHCQTREQALAAPSMARRQS